jgi:2-succinyl-6-hydroxy-2,4-cyclohexadiene-1-carboxylate synthase
LRPAGAALHAEVWGAAPSSGAAAPLVLLHGFTGDTTVWAAFARELVRVDGPRVLVAVDLPGHGRSASSRVDSPEAGARAALVAARDALRRAGVAAGALHCLGYSMGGRLALTLACDRPAEVASLCLVGATAGIASAGERAERRAADRRLADDLLAGGVEAFVDGWLRQPLFASQNKLDGEVREAARRQRLAGDEAGWAAALAACGTGSMAPRWDELPRLSTPALLVAGELDAKFTELAARMAALLPRARLCVVPGAGHAVQLERPGALAAEVGAFLREVEGGAPGSGAR